MFLLIYFLEIDPIAFAAELEGSESTAITGYHLLAYFSTPPS
jgi:hypothetical protein